MMNGKREFWQMVAMAAIMSGRKTVAEAAAAADELAKVYEARLSAWDEEERRPSDV
jgi:hypothetical protein